MRKGSTLINLEAIPLILIWHWILAPQWSDLWSPFVISASIDSELTMKTHILKVVSLQDVAQQLVSAFILPQLNYCNSLLSRLPGSTIQPLQRVMNAAARVIMNLSLRDHVKPVLKQLHWLPVEQRITYKLCLFMHYIHIRLPPKYLSDQFLQLVADTGWSLLAQGFTFPKKKN